MNILKSLIIKNLCGRYKNTLLGFTWHFITPIMLLLVYYIVFTNIKQQPINDYWIYLASGIFPFNFMISCLTNGSTSIISNTGLIKKIYIPRELIVISNVLSSFIIMLIGYAIILCLVVISGAKVNINALIILIPIFILMLFFVMGYTMALSSITVFVKDVQYILNTVCIGFYFLTPMYFIADNLSGTLQKVVWINPFTYFIDSYHQIIYYAKIPNLQIILVCVFLSGISLLIGIVIFEKLKGKFAERL